MWILVLGATGTGKNLVAEHLEKEGFDYPKPDMKPQENVLMTELGYMMARLRCQIRAAHDKDRTDVVTVRSFFDSYEIMVEIARRLRHIDEAQSKIFDLIYENLIGHDYFLKPPHMVIWMKTEKMSARNRQLLKGVDVSDEFFNLEVELYEEFVKKIAVPVVDLDAAQPADRVIAELDFNISNIKATHLGGQTLWEKRFFKL